jgi:hypothetical protein
MLKERMMGLAIAAAAAWGTGCSSSEAPPPTPAKASEQAKTSEPAKVSAIKFVPQGTPQGGALHESWKGIPLGDATEKGLKWLISVQGQDGGWGQDGGNEGDSRKGVNLESTGNDLANTSLVCLAILRSGSTMKAGPYSEALRKGVDYVIRNVEAAPAQGLTVTNRQGTQIQRKLGPYIDTFLSTMLLSEIDGAMADDAGQKRVTANLGKCIAKIEKNQQKDGSWNQGGGWAPIISTSIASRSLYNAQQKGNAVDAACLTKVDEYTRGNWDNEKKQFRANDGAGVELYVAAQSLEQASRAQVATVPAKPVELSVAGKPAPAADPAPKGIAALPEATAAEKAKMAEAEAVAHELRDGATKKLAGASFVAGFGSMGGEEFVSYLNISDSLLRSGGKEWTEWNGKIKERLVKLQNQDGTWAGHHCITGRVACTASAVMTILAERTAPKS